MTHEVCKEHVELIEQTTVKTPPPLSLPEAA
jgi:hypothetical protein